MNSVRDYHNEAVRFAQLALEALQRGEEVENKKLIRRAMAHETQAADLVPEETASEPTRSILYRSAASFAYQAGAFEEAERLIFKGLAGYPTALTKQQLLDVQAMINDALDCKDDKVTDNQSRIQSIITAVYENGVLHPTVALPLKERQTVEIHIMPELSLT